MIKEDLLVWSTYSFYFVVCNLSLLHHIRAYYYLEVVIDFWPMMIPFDKMLWCRTKSRSSSVSKANGEKSAFNEAWCTQACICHSCSIGRVVLQSGPKNFLKSPRKILFNSKMREVTLPQCKYSKSLIPGAGKTRGYGHYLSFLLPFRNAQGLSFTVQKSIPCAFCTFSKNRLQTNVRVTDLVTNLGTKNRGSTQISNN